MMGSCPSIPSMGTGATYLPLAVLKTSFMRPVMVR
jgi:hypothetical protein